MTQEGQAYRFRVPVYLDDLEPDAVGVILYAEPVDSQGAEWVPMVRAAPLPGVVKGFCYMASVAVHRPAEDYRPRLIPAHTDVSIPLEVGHILWLR